MKLKENKVTSAMVEKLVEYCVNNLKYGDTLTYGTIETITTMNRDSKHWNGFVVKFRKMVRRQKGWCFHPVTNVGYRLLTPTGTVTERMMYRGKKAMRQAAMAKSEASAVHDSELTQHHRAIKYQVIQSHNATRRKAMATRRFLAAVMKKDK